MTLKQEIANYHVMKKLFPFCCLLVVAALLTGCGTPGFPKQSYDPKKQIKQLEAEFEKPNLITNFYALTNTTAEVKKTARDKIITGHVALIDLNYNQFIARFSVTKESLDFGTEVTQLGLNLATTAVGGAETKTILAAVASGVTGSKLAVDKNFFFEKTVPVLITTMNAQRKVALAPILIGMTNNTDDYSLTRALSDIDGYYFAGTFIGALQSIQADSGVKDSQAATNIVQIRNTQFVAEAAQHRISAILDQIDKMTNAPAILDLQKNPPVNDPDVDHMVDLRDPGSQRFTNGGVAKQMLKMRVVMSGKRNEQELAAWEAAVKSTQ